jgi:transposase-like protein
MAKTEQFTESRQERQMRYFSESFKKQKVRELEKNQTTIAEVCRQYQVRRSSVYKWVYKYSIMKKRGVKQVVELKSDTQKLISLQQKVKELEQIIGQKQIELEFKDKMIEIAEEMYKIDIKKKFGSKPSSGSGTTGKGTKGN